MLLVSKAKWPNGPTYWRKKDILYISIPFTWNLPSVKAQIKQINFFLKKIIVGGPAVRIMPDYFDHIKKVKVGDSYPGVLQLVNPLATKTTTGCIRNCGFCIVQKIEGELKELSTWPNLPIVCDNNLLGASESHFECVMLELIKKWGWADFNQGIDARLLTKDHAELFARLDRSIIRLALDSMSYYDSWEHALFTLLEAGVRKNSIRSLAIIGYKDTPEEAWKRLRKIESFNVNPLPMWFHELDTLQHAKVTDKQKELGWTEYRMTQILTFYYGHTLMKYRPPSGEQFISYPIAKGRTKRKKKSNVNYFTKDKI